MGNNSYLAQMNMGRLLYPFEDPRISEFRESLDRVNAVADRSPGFVWRFKEEMSAIRDYLFDGDEMLLMTMSVWKSLDDLESFVWRTVHKQFYDRKHSWFIDLPDPYFVMWTVPRGHHPDVREAKERLDFFATNGDSEFAFGWSYASQRQQTLRSREHPYASQNTNHTTT